MARHAHLLVMGMGIALACAGCTRFPALEGRVGADLAARDFPQLIPLGGVLSAGSAGPDLPTLQSDLDARAARLRARAAALRGPVLNRADRIRLQRGISR